MHPTISEQLRGLSKALAEVVAPELSNPYPSDVLSGVIGALDMLAQSWQELPAYLRWDAEATAAVLARRGVEPPDPPADPLDIAGLEAHHAAVRGLLERLVPQLAADPDTNAATVALFRERIERFPFNQLAPRRQ